MKARFDIYQLGSVHRYVDRLSVRYASRRGDDAELRAKIRDIATERRRFGYRRVQVLLQREGVQ